VYTRRFVATRGEPLLALAAGQLGVAAVVLLVLAPVIANDAVSLSMSVVLAVLTLGAVGTGVAYFLFHGLVREEGATTAAVVTYLIPVVAIILGVVVKDEPVTWNMLAGAGVVIFGVALAEGRLTGEPPPVPEADAHSLLPVVEDD
jgi:drug/metabolite transporter (DMT)-like permease